MTNRFKWYPNLPGNRQIGRSIHFLIMCAFVVFLVVSCGDGGADRVRPEHEPHRRGHQRHDDLVGVYLGLVGIGVVVAVNALANWLAWRHPRAVQHVAKAIVTPVMRFFLDRPEPLAEFRREDISPFFWANGKMPTCEEWKALAANDFKDYRLKVYGLVENPVELSLDDLRAMGKKTQITLHHCIQGWSGIAEWGGLPLAELVKLVRPKPGVRAVVFYSFGEGAEGGQFYDSLSMQNAMRPQTLLAYEMNFEPLNHLHGAPLRLRVENQLGFKMVKWIQAIEFVESVQVDLQGRRRLQRGPRILWRVGEHLTPVYRPAARDFFAAIPYAHRLRLRVRNSVTHQGGCRVTQHTQEATLERRPATLFEELYRTPLGKAVVARSEDYLATLPDESIDLVADLAAVRAAARKGLRQSRSVGLRRLARVVRAADSPRSQGDGQFRAGPRRRLSARRAGAVAVQFPRAAAALRRVRLLSRRGVLLAQPRQAAVADRVGQQAQNPSEGLGQHGLVAVEDAASRRPTCATCLTPYSDRMRKLLKDPSKFFSPDKRPSGHDIGLGFSADNGGAIPSNLLSYPNTESNSLYLRLCKRFGLTAHPARFPEALPEFFIKFLTDPGDLVLDIFAGSNTTGRTAERLGRRWLAVDCDRDYVAASALRFMDGWSDEEVRRYLAHVQRGRSYPRQIARGRCRRWQGERPRCRAVFQTAFRSRAV